MTFLRRSRKDEPKYIDLCSASPSKTAAQDREAKVQAAKGVLGENYLLAEPVPRLTKPSHLLKNISKGKH